LRMKIVEAKIRRLSAAYWCINCESTVLHDSKAERVCDCGTILEYTGWIETT